MEKLNCVEDGTLQGDKEGRFNLELRVFGVDRDTISDTPTLPTRKRVVYCSIDKWEEPLLNENKTVAKFRLLRKHRQPLFIANEEQFAAYALSQDKIHRTPFREVYSVLLESQNNTLVKMMTLFSPLKPAKGKSVHFFF